MNFSKNMLLKQIDTAVYDLQSLLISLEEFKKNNDVDNLQKKIDNLEKEIKQWQDKYNQLHQMYLELLNYQQRQIVLFPYQPYVYPSKTIPNEDQEPFWTNQTYSPNSFSSTSINKEDKNES